MNKIIFSVYRNDRAEETNRNNHRNVLKTLKGLNIPCFEVIGVYKGSKERSIVVYSMTIESHSDRLELIKGIASKHSQESILEVHHDGYSLLHYLKEFKSVYIGHFKSTEKDTAIRQDCYTFEPVSKQYYIVE